MKKGAFLCAVLFFFLMISFAIAEDVVKSSGDQGTSLAEDTVKAGAATQNGLESVSTSFSDQSNTVLEKSVALPANFAFIGSLLGMKGDVDLRRLVVLLCLWVLVFLIIRQALVFAPFFGEGALSWVGGVVITMLVALSGGLIAAADFFYELGGLFGVIRNQTVFQLLLTIVVLLFFFTLFSKILKKVTLEARKAKARALGEELREGAQSAKLFTKARDDLSRMRT